MALTVLKNTPIHCVVKIYGSGEETIVLDDTIVHSTQSPGEGTARVNISSIWWSIPQNAATIARDEEVLWTLKNEFKFEFHGFADSEYNDSDIVVTLPAQGGTVILELLKIEGYGDSQHPYQSLPEEE